MTDRGRSFLAATPAMAGLSVALTLTVVVLYRGAEPPASQLSARAARAIAEKDDATALLTQQHLMAVEPGKPEHTLAMARTLDRMTRRGEAVAVLATVAPIDRTGFPSAHLQLAEWAIEQRVLGGVGDGATLRIARFHAEAARGDEKLASRARGALDTLAGLTPTTRPRVSAPGTPRKG